MKIRVLVSSIALILSFAAFHTLMAQNPDDIMTNEEVISLTKAGLATSVIVGKIKTSKCEFDLSTDALIKLKQAGVNDNVVFAMLETKSGKPLGVSTSANNTEMMPGDPNDPLAKHTYGIYLYEERGGQKKMTQLQPNVSAQNRTGGLFTSSLTYGIGKVKIKANLPGRNASLQIKETQPVFYFYLDVESGGLNTTSGIPSTPKEFVLVRFNQRSDNREVTIGKANAFGAKGGLSDEYVVPYLTEDLGNGIFKITMAAPLKKGEYGFYLVNSGNSNASTAIGTKFFDFGVNLAP